MAGPVEAPATAKRSGRRAVVSPCDAAREESGSWASGERATVVRKSSADQRRPAGSVDLSRDREFLEGFAIRGADAASEPRIYAGGDRVASNRHRREHGDF